MHMLDMKTCVRLQKPHPPLLPESLCVERLWEGGGDSVVCKGYKLSTELRGLDPNRYKEERDRQKTMRWNGDAER